MDSLLKQGQGNGALPNNFRFVLERERPTIFAYGTGRHKRWEFQLGIGEAMPDELTMKSWAAKYAAPDTIEVTRVAQYAHHSLVATRWRQNRLFLIGDAAHMMPPSAGQGLCSGIRDAINLAWKLGAAPKGQAATPLLDTYEEERKPHLYAILRRTLFFGSRLQGGTPLQRLWRYVQLRAIQQVPRPPKTDCASATTRRLPSWAEFWGSTRLPAAIYRRCPSAISSATTSSATNLPSLPFRVRLQKRSTRRSVRNR